MLPPVRRVASGAPSLWYAHQPTLMFPPAQPAVLCLSLPLFHPLLLSSFVCSGLLHYFSIICAIKCFWRNAAQSPFAHIPLSRSCPHVYSGQKLMITNIFSCVTAKSRLHYIAAAATRHHMRTTAAINHTPHLHLGNFLVRQTNAKFTEKRHENMPPPPRIAASFREASQRNRREFAIIGCISTVKIAARAHAREPSLTYFCIVSHIFLHRQQASGQTKHEKCKCGRRCAALQIK